MGKYEYDGLGRRVKKHLDSDSPASPNGVDGYVHYFYNGAWQVLETRWTATESAQPENLQPEYQYVWSARYIDAAVLRDENTDQDSLCDDERVYYLADANYNVTCLADTGGDAVERYLYDPYGVVTIYDGAWSSARSSSRYENAILYTDRRHDAETGLYYYRARYYDAGLGQFFSHDPIGFAARDPNLQRYVANNPVNGTDPSGLDVAILQGGVHTGIIVEYWDAEGNFVGLLSADFQATGFGDDRGKAEWRGVAVLWGATGQLVIGFTSNGELHGDRIVHGSKDLDRRLVDWILAQVGKDRRWVEEELIPDKHSCWLYPVPTSRFKKYYVAGQNYNHFTLAALSCYGAVETDCNSNGCISDGDSLIEFFDEHRADPNRFCPLPVRDSGWDESRIDEGDWEDCRTGLKLGHPPY